MCVGRVREQIVSNESEGAGDVVSRRLCIASFIGQSVTVILHTHMSLFKTHMNHRHCHRHCHHDVLPIYYYYYLMHHHVAYLRTSEIV